jgi:CDP-diacylglycerol--glycerol-3-phosphate 3-phosphatidyltransferase
MQDALVTRGARWPYAASVALAVVVALTTAVVAITDDLPIRDPDGVAGSPAMRLTIILVVFAALDVIPRALYRAGRELTSVPQHFMAVVRERWSLRRTLLVLAGLLSFYVCYVGYRNLKGFLPFVRPELHDIALLDLDRAMFGGHDPAQVLRDGLGTGFVAQMLSSVYVFYLGFVPLSLGVALVWSKNVRRGLWWATALNLNWVLGVASYYLLPSLGPVFAAPDRFAAMPATPATALQESLQHARNEVIQLGPHATELMQSIAGFASLHVSVVLSAAMLASMAKAPRLLRTGLWAYLALTLLATIYLGWHYIVDDIAGAVIGVLAVWLGAIATGHRVELPSFPILRDAFNVPNALSFARILLVPWIIVLVLDAPGGSVTAALVFGAGALTDVLDGYIARSRGLITPLGKLFDPLADKLLVLGALGSLVAVDRLPLWVAAVIVSREIVVTAVRAHAARRGEILPADNVGKVKMGFQVAMVLALMAASDTGAAWVQLLVAATVALTVASGVRYLIAWRRVAMPAGVRAA